MRFADSDLSVICDYLGLPRPSLIYSREADQNHLNNPRQFAMVESGKNAIYVSGAIEHVPPDVRMGLLIHELGHIHGSLDEVDADAWVLSVAPEAGYHYEAEVTFKSPLYEEPVTAKNIQCVSQQFMRSLGHMEED
jgi:hypothetical protein